MKYNKKCKKIHNRDSKERKITIIGNGFMKKIVFIHSRMHEANIFGHFPISQIDVRSQEQSL